MIKSIRCTLVADGTSDRVLLPLLEWVLRQSGTPLPFVLIWAVPRAPGATVERILAAIEDSECDMIFIHRDAEKEVATKRYEEIENAMSTLQKEVPFVGVVPVRMTEAWLLIDEAAIRRASGNPNGRVKVDLPSVNTLERISDPKDVLSNLLCTASELSGRRLKMLQRDISQRRIRVSAFIKDYSPLRILPSFQRLEQETNQVIRDAGWL